EFLRSNPSTLREAFFRARITKACFEDERTTTTITSPNDLNIAVPDQVLEESTLHTSDKWTQLNDTKDEKYRAIKDAAALRAKLNSLQQQAINGDLGAITSMGGLPNHMEASEKELPVLKSPLEQESMFRRQEGMLR
ncbi:hypothetical protein Tco_0868350, partial [Tanacetum coccineum]